MFLLIVCFSVHTYCEGYIYNTSKDFFELPGHDSLLRDVAVLFYWQDNWVVCGGKGVLLDALYDLDEPDLRGEGVSVVDDRLTISSIPTVHWQ